LSAAAVDACTCVTRYPFHPSPPFGRRFGAYQRPAAYLHQCRPVPAFREIVEMRAADAVPAAELRDGRGKRVGEWKRVSTDGVLH